MIQASDFLVLPSEVRAAFDEHDRKLSNVECEMLRRQGKCFIQIGNDSPVEVSHAQFDYMVDGFNKLGIGDGD